MTIQSSYSINPGKGFAGLIARPNDPTSVDLGIIGTAGQPGQPVIYDTGTGRFNVVSSAAQSRAAIGILTYRRSELQDSATSLVTFAAGDEVEIVTFGTVWLTAGGAVRYGQKVRYQTDDSKWDALTPPNRLTGDSYDDDNIQDLTDYFGSVSIVSVSTETIADDQLFEGRIGYGRIA